MTDSTSMPSKHESIVRGGRVAIGTQGALYIVVGILATRIAQGIRGPRPASAEPSRPWPANRWVRHC